MLQTRYITVNDFNNYFPEINLREELGTEENAVAFIVRLENRMETFINANFKMIKSLLNLAFFTTLFFQELMRIFWFKDKIVIKIKKEVVFFLTTSS